MVKKKRSKKARISKEDEIAINRKITFGATLTLLFLLLFLFTQLESRDSQTEPFKELTPKEKIEQTERSAQEVTDQTNYQRALTFDNRVYCEFIKDSALKTKCEQQTPELVEQEPVEESSQNVVVDQTNYQRALTFQNTVYCDLIVDEELRTDCYSQLEG